MAFGKKSSFTGGGTFKKRNTWSIKPGDNVIRILPQMHSLAEDENGWHVYERMHWGYAGVDTKDPSKVRGKPFRCIREDDRRNGLVLQECPECTKREAVEAEMKETEARLTTEGKEKGLKDDKLAEYVAAGLEPIKLWLKAHNVDAKTYLAVKKGEEYGQFKVPYRMYKAMRDKMAEIETSDEINALALDQGLLFNIIRSGDGFAVPDTFEIVQENVVIDGKKYKQYKLAPISDEEAAKALEEIEDLAKAGGMRLTFDQIQALVDCSGDPEEVDRIIGSNTGMKAETKVEAPKAQTNEMPPKAAAAKPANDTVVTTQEVDPAIQARLDAIKAKQAAEAKANADAAAAAKIPPATTALLDMSDEDFLAQMQVAGK